MIKYDYCNNNNNTNDNSNKNNNNPPAMLNERVYGGLPHPKWDRLYIQIFDIPS